ncbi:restriction endonuclease [Longimicrobium terrae]|uniref:Restriction system protein n=1 Tax=Longimicrobium terrae TaxID=1639882 RepID=A0A841H7T3_9BACT|nr:restriction endonuclease [Longimicrobium terrae]MBB4639623.1 restriction system protein [Longimicrobium terrae]MBB6073974.1 restriction system protein [Longimicrobium terrae]
MERLWMVRAGERGYLADAFKERQCVAIGFRESGDFTPIQSLAEMRQRIWDTGQDRKPGALGNAASMAWRFRGEMKPGDRVITYDPATRQYLIGEITGGYEYEPGRVPDYAHVRSVSWTSQVNRDDLSVESRNVLGSTLTLFQPGPDVAQELEALAVRAEAGSVDEDPLPPRPSPEAFPQAEPETGPESETDWEVIRRDLVDRAHEFIKDRLLSLSPSDMEELTASVLRAMGYKARVTGKGPDRGRDVTASPDGLGFQSPRIVAEVKHRPRNPIGAPLIRSFLGGLRSGENGLYVSTGGFTQEAKYEAERASFPLTLVDLDDLASLVVEHYDRFDAQGRVLLPLTRIYWPVA